MKFTILLITSFIIISLQQASGQFKNCRYEYSNYYKCLNDVNEDFNNIKTLNAGQWTQLENDVKQCYQIFQCQNPWIIDGVRNVRKSCFNTQRNRMRNDLQTCMRNYYDKNFDLQQEATENSVYNRYGNYINKLSQNQMICYPQVNKGQLNTCVRDRIKQRSTKVRATGNKCQSKQYKCDQKITNECYDQWQRRIRPGVRDCISKLQSSGRLESYKRNYVACVNRRDQRYRTPNEDVNLQYFNYLQQVFGNIQETCAKKKIF